MDPESEAPAQQDTPPESAPTGTPDEPQVDWRKRYEDLRPQFDRTAQEAAALRAEQQRLDDEAYQRELMQRWGYEVEEPEPQYVDPNEELRQKLAEIEEWRNNLTAEQQQAQALANLSQSVDEQFRSIDPDMDEQTREWITSRALNNDPREDGMPDVAKAYEEFTAWETERQKQWRASKRRAPLIQQGGTEATSAPNLDDQEQRRAWMAEQLADRNA